MKIVLAVVGVLILIPVLFFGAMYAASELGGEVVVLHRQSADGSVSRVRIWIVEDAAGTWVEHGAPDADWITLLDRDPEITLECAGQAHTYRAVADRGAHTRYHELRRDKYGWADGFVEIATSDAASCAGVPVRIELVR